MKAVLNPSMTDHQPPEVQQDTRGRPTTKVKQQKNKDLNHRGTTTLKSQMCDVVVQRNQRRKKYTSNYR